MSNRFVLLAALSASFAYSAFAANDTARPRVGLTTSLGEIVLELDPEKAPGTTRNFLGYVDDGFYDGLVFHRVVAGFVIQAGGYEADMTYREPRAPIVNEAGNGLLNVRGTIAMARTDDPDSAESQFFINVADNGNLDRAPGRPGYAVFGRVVDGLDVVEAIELSDTHIENGVPAVPVEPVVIERARRLP